MKRIAVILLLLLTGLSFAKADSVIARQAIPARSIIMAEDLRVTGKTVAGAIRSIDDVIGREARVTIYAGRPVRSRDITAPALIERNQIVRIRFSNGPLMLEADGRALGRGGAGDRISVMNLGSRTVVTGTVALSGLIEVHR